MDVQNLYKICISVQTRYTGKSDVLFKMGGIFIDSEVTVHISNLLCVLELIFILAGSDLLLSISLFVGQVFSGGSC